MCFHYAPVELAQSHFMIGRNDCSEQRFNSATGEWVDSVRSWDACYYMNGFAIRDEGEVWSYDQWQDTSL